MKKQPSLQSLIKDFITDWEDSTGKKLSMKKAKEIIGKSGLAEWKDQIKRGML